MQGPLYRGPIYRGPITARGKERRRDGANGVTDRGSEEGREGERKREEGRRRIAAEPRILLPQDICLGAPIYHAPWHVTTELREPSAVFPGSLVSVVMNVYLETRNALLHN